MAEPDYVAINGEGWTRFLRGSTLSVLCAPDERPTTERLVRPQQGLYRLDWPETDADEAGVEFHLGTGDLFRILGASGFELLELFELFAPEDAVDHEYYPDPPAEWARRWPSEEVWRVRARA